MKNLLTRLAWLIVSAGLLSGCSTMFSSRPTAAVMIVRDGKAAAPTKAEFKATRESIAATLAMQHLRLVENVGDAHFIATVEVRPGADGKQPVTLVRSVAVNQLRSFRSATSEDYGRRPLLSDSVHPSIRLTEQNQQLEQWKGSRVP